MEFNVERLMRLSGIDTDDESSRFLTESSDYEEDMDEADAADDDDTLEEEDESVNGNEEITEATVRRVVKEEIQAALKRLKSGKSDKKRSDSEWLYGSKKPKNSRTGQITKGFRGIGFI